MVYFFGEWGDINCTYKEVHVCDFFPSAISSLLFQHNFVGFVFFKLPKAKAFFGGGPTMLTFLFQFLKNTWQICKVQ